MNVTSKSMIPILYYTSYGGKNQEIPQISLDFGRRIWYNGDRKETNKRRREGAP
jgi:hypothetical protein